MLLEASCHCGRVAFTVQAPEPVPFKRCYCSICRKTAGSGGFAINLGAQAATLKLLRGKRNLRIYRARMPEAAERGSGEHADRDDDGTPLSSGRRHFCGRCGSPLWLWDPRWPELIHPHAGAIDTPLPEPPENVHIMLGSKPAWVAVEGRPDDAQFQTYPDCSLAEWHARRGLTSATD
jgi:hypothetical protein